MNINCLSCGYKVNLDEAYEDYAGEIKCYVCGGAMEIRIEEARVKSVRRVGANNPPATAESQPTSP